MSDYISKSALVDSIMENVVITTEEGLELRGEIVDLIKNQPTLDEKEITRKAMERIIKIFEEEIKQNPEASLREYRAGLYKAVEIASEEGEIK